MKKYYTKNNMAHVVEYGKSDVYTYPHEECKDIILTPNVLLALNSLLKKLNKAEVSKVSEAMQMLKDDYYIKFVINQLRISQSSICIFTDEIPKKPLGIICIPVKDANEEMAEKIMEQEVHVLNMYIKNQMYYVFDYELLTNKLCITCDRIYSDKEGNELFEELMDIAGIHEEFRDNP